MPKKPPKPPTKTVRKPAVPRPDLPQHRFEPPFDLIFRLGEAEEPEAVYREIADVIRSGDAEAGVKRLAAIALDTTFNDYWDDASDTDDPRTYARVHALSVLEELPALAQSTIEPLLPLLNDEDDLVMEEMPFFFAMMGEPAIEPVHRVLLDPDADLIYHCNAAESLSEIAEKNPLLRDRCRDLLTRALASLDDPSVLSFVVLALMDIGEIDAYPSIAEAFEKDRLDTGVVDLRDVEEHFGLPVTQRPTEKAAALDPTSLWRDPDAFEDEDDEFDGEREPSVPFVAEIKVGRNEPCSCGSGKKYKKCCGAAA